MTITYQVETYADVIDEIWPMLEDHYQEIATDKAIKPFIPDLDKYQAMEDAGMLRIFTARDTLQGSVKLLGHERGRLVGYFVSFVMKHMHYSETTMAINDIMYVDPTHRGSTVGYRLIKLASLDLKNLGADILIIHMKCDYPFRSLLTKLDFHLTEENWERVL
jgi:GNAT superfamily N-acetyltransferase